MEDLKPKDPPYFRRIRKWNTYIHNADLGNDYSIILLKVVCDRDDYTFQNRFPMISSEEENFWINKT